MRHRPRRRFLPSHRIRRTPDATFPRARSSEITHVHTSFSMDAGAFGCRLAPADAYRFAKGEEVTASSGQRARLARPLDFIVVTDHSDGFGFFPQLLRGNADLLAYPQGRKWYDVINSGQGAAAAVEIIGSFTQETIAKGLLPVPGTLAYRGAWQETIKAADEANDPGHFTAFIGYEWTSTTGGNNLHRNVIFRQNAAVGQPGGTCGGLAYGAGDTQHGVVLVRVSRVDSKEQSADE